jgi:uncharacterized protein with HEPN domain
MNESDAIRLRHMLDAAQKARAFARGYSRRDLDKNEMLTLSLVKCVEIIGEAANRVSERCQKENPGIPWEDIIGMRNRLIHAYFDINLNILWNTIQNDLPPLIAELKMILPPER